MVGFFQELAKKLAERWLTLLVVPGAMLLAAVWAGLHLGHAHALSVDLLNTNVVDARIAVGEQPGGTQALLVIAVLLGAAGVGLVVQALAGMTRRLWLGLWPKPLKRALVNRRRRRWTDRLNARRALESTCPADARTAAQQDEVNALAARVNRLAQTRPGRPTWMGDRMHGVEQIALNRHGLDLAFGWPRLWLVLPDTARTEISSAHAAFAAAVAVGTWAWPYLLLAILWWPAAAIAVGIGVTGWARARSAVADLAAISESAVDLYGRLLATSLGVALEGSVGPLAVAEGEKVTSLIRKGR